MFEAYKVAVRLSLINNVGAGLASLATQFQSLNRQIGSAQGGLSALERQMLGLKRTGLIGGAMAAAGGFGLSLLDGPLKAAREYETAYAVFKTLNLGEAVNRQADQFARGASVWGASSKQLMETLRETYGMIGDIDKAKAIAPTIASLNSANAMLFGGKVGSIDSGATKSIMRFIDMRGLTNTPEQIKHGLDLAQRLVTGSGGALQFGDLESFAKRGGTAFKSMSEDGLLLMATVMQEMGGASAGTGLMSAYQNLVAGRTTKKSMAALQDLGLAQLGYVNHGDVGGKPYRTLQISEMKDAKLLRENFPQWIMQTVLPALEKKGITDVGEQAAMVNDILSNRTGSNLGVNFVTQFIQALRDAKMVKQAMGVDETIENAKNTPDGAILEMHKKWENLLTELGETVLPIAIKGVTWLNETIKATISLAREFPTLTKGIVIAFGALSAVVAVGGTLALAVSGFKALGLALGAGAAGGATGLAGAAGAASLAVGKLISGFAMLAGSFAVGYAGGTIAKYGIDYAIEKITGRDETLGTWLYGITHDEKPVESVRPASNKTVQVTSEVHLDGRKIASAVTSHQEKSMARANRSGGSAFDPTTSLPAPILNYGR